MERLGARGRLTVAKGKPKTNAKLKSAGGRLDPKALRPPPGAEPGHVTVSFEFADRTHSGSWSWPTGDDAALVLDFLCEISRSRWGELLAQETGGRNRHKKHHSYDFGTVAAEAQARLAELRHDETFSEFFRFRLSGEGRLWGYVRDGVFYVLWWDADHKVSPSTRRNT